MNVKSNSNVNNLNISTNASSNKPKKAIIIDPIKPVMESLNVLGSLFNNNENVKTETFNIEDQLSDDGGIYDKDNYNRENDENMFGGNQGYLYNHLTRFLNDKNVDAILKKYFPNQNITEEDKEALFYRIKNVGCGYTAASNTLMLYYTNGNEAEFEEKFGYPLYTKWGDIEGNTILEYNTSLVLLDFFLYYNTDKGTDHYFDTIEDMYGNAKEQMNSDTKDDDGFFGFLKPEEKKEGARGTNTTEVANEFKKYLSEHDIYIEISNDLSLKPGSDEYNENKLKNMLGIEIGKSENKSTLTKEELKKVLEMEGKQVIMSDSDFSLYLPYDEDGNGKLDDIAMEDVGSHAMAIVKVLPDGRYLVSSWGDEYIYDPEQDANKGFNYAIYDYNN